MNGFGSFQKEMETLSGGGMPAPAYLLISSDAFFFHEALVFLSEKWQTSVYDLENKESTATVVEAIDTLNTRSLFGDTRCVIVKNLQGATKGDLLAMDGYAENPAPGNVFVLFYLVDPKSKKTLPKPHTTIKQVYLDMKKSELPGWIESKAVGYGVKFSKDVVRFLVETQGGDLFSLDNEVKKLSLLGKKAISMEDVKEVSFGSIQYSAFSLVDSLRDDSSVRAIGCYERLAVESSDEFMLLGLLNSSMQRMGLSADQALACFEFLADTDLKMRIAGAGNFPHEVTILGLQAILKRNRSTGR
ncbi:MAG: hypothetical protein HQK89_08015 [Nitrospirae bacterium]|nr:hypothetical protein [Nitrospirota bacterium]